jgi:hypothetical protein
MADLGNYPAEFNACCDVWRSAFRKIKSVSIDYGVSDRDMFFPASMGSKADAYKAYQSALSHTYQGQPFTPALVELALRLMLSDRIKAVRETKKANMAMLSTELNRPLFLDYLEQAWEAQEEERQEAN